MKIRQPDPTLELASRIYSYREDGESWTDAVDRYARTVLMRHPRTVHRWLSGESPMPAVVADSLSTDSRAYEDVDQLYVPGGQSGDDHLAHIQSEAQGYK